MDVNDTGARLAPAQAIPVPPRRRPSPAGRLLRTPRTAFALAVLLMIALTAAFAGVLAPYGPEDMDFDHLLAPLSWSHLLGTDQLGRDTLSRLMHGSRIALLVSLAGVGLGVLIGTPLGLLAAYLRGWAEDLLMRAVDAIAVFPSVLFAVALAAVMGPSALTVILAIGLANAPWIARVVRAQGLSVREQDFVAAAVAGGMGTPRIILAHVLPHTFAPVVVQASLGLGYAVLSEAALGFLGIGVQPPTPTWGNMLQDAFPMMQERPFLSIAPGIAIFLLVLAFNLLGDALRDTLDPRLRSVTH